MFLLTQEEIESMKDNPEVGRDKASKFYDTNSMVMTPLKLQDYKNKCSGEWNYNEAKKWLDDYFADIEYYDLIISDSNNLKKYIQCVEDYISNTKEEIRKKEKELNKLEQPSGKLTGKRKKLEDECKKKKDLLNLKPQTNNKGGKDSTKKDDINAISDNIKKLEKETREMTITEQMQQPNNLKIAAKIAELKSTINLELDILDRFSHYLKRLEDHTKKKEEPARFPYYAKVGIGYDPRNTSSFPSQVQKSIDILLDLHESGLIFGPSHFHYYKNLLDRSQQKNSSLDQEKDYFAELFFECNKLSKEIDKNTADNIILKIILKQKLLEEEREIIKERFIPILDKHKKYNLNIDNSTNTKDLEEEQNWKTIENTSEEVQNWETIDTSEEDIDKIQEHLSFILYADFCLKKTKEYRDENTKQQIERIEKNKEIFSSTQVDEAEAEAQQLCSSKSK